MSATSLSPEFVEEADRLFSWLEDNKGDAGLVKWKDTFFKMCEKHDLLYYMQIPPSLAGQFANYK